MSASLPVCAFGFFDPEGQRSWVILKGLMEMGCDVRICRTEAKGFWPKIRDLRRQWCTASRECGALLVLFPGHYLMPLAWWLARKRRIPVVLDVFISLYETDVSDRRRVSRWHPKAWMLWLVDWLACTLADRILIDTEDHRDALVRRFGAAREKFFVIPVGCRTDLFFPKETRHSPPFLVRFHGSFIPLHGIETILDAAAEVRDQPIRFELAGKGQTFAAMQRHAEERRLTNVRFVGMKTLREIPDFIAEADACLGIFGTGEKAGLVIPTKAFEILAMGRPLISARTPASERVLHDRDDALLIEPGDAHALAQAILTLQEHPELAREIARNGHALFLEKFQPRTVVEPLVEWMRQNT